ncbi:MAG: SDR family oxidoreductase [Nitrococcus mobilis]|nr:SDR family oxidoreductase [Nitrococcus mobilis]
MSYGNAIITGASGLVGSAVVPEVAKLRPILSLGRSNQPIAGLNLPFIPIDLKQKNLGIADPKEVFKNAHFIIHCAADVRWNQSEQNALRSNTEATTELVGFAKRYAPRLQNFIYISTAFVDILQKNLDRKPSLSDFNNAYEYSKYLAEEEVKSSGLPFTVIRPSIVMGRQSDGAVSRFLSIYQLVYLYNQNLLPFLVGDGDAHLDIVSLDTVTEAIAWSLNNPSHSLGKTVYACSGIHAPTLATVISLGKRTVNKARQQAGLTPRGEVTIINPEVFERFFLPIMKKSLPRNYEVVRQALECFRPYLNIRTCRKPELAFISKHTTPLLLRSFEFWCEQRIRKSAREYANRTI